LRPLLLLLLLFILTANGDLAGDSGTKIRHSTQNYTNNKGHTHTEYNANTITTTRYITTGFTVLQEN
jgi:hypothetical protein